MPHAPILRLGLLHFPHFNFRRHSEPLSGEESLFALRGTDTAAYRHKCHKTNETYVNASETKSDVSKMWPTTKYFPCGQSLCEK
jgi:hypothetical protein